MTPKHRKTHRKSPLQVKEAGWVSQERSNGEFQKNDGREKQIKGLCPGSFPCLMDVWGPQDANRGCREWESPMLDSATHT